MDLKALVRNGIRKNESLPLADLVTLKSIANVSLEIDRETNDYFYRIDLNDLVDKFKVSVLEFKEYLDSLCNKK